MKITKFNQKLVKRLVSYTLAGSLAITSAPIKIVKASDKICPEEKQYVK